MIAWKIFLSVEMTEYVFFSPGPLKAVALQHLLMTLIRLLNNPMMTFQTTN